MVDGEPKTSSTQLGEDPTDLYDLTFFVGLPCGSAGTLPRRFDGDSGVTLMHEALDERDSRRGERGGVGSWHVMDSVEVVDEGMMESDVEAAGIGQALGLPKTFQESSGSVSSSVRSDDSSGSGVGRCAVNGQRAASEDCTETYLSLCPYFWQLASSSSWQHDHPGVLDAPNRLVLRVASHPPQA